MKYALIVTQHDGTQEVYGPYSNRSVELWRERVETLGWVDRVSVVACYSPGSVRVDYNHAKQGS